MTSTADDVGQENSISRAIQNEYIVEHLFSFLSLNDIKHCRLTNRTWRNVGTKILRRRTRVIFDLREKGFHKNNSMKEVCDYCKENTPENTPISSFEFRGRIECFQLFTFLGDVSSFTRELKIECGICHDGDGNGKIFDISPKIAPHLTKLHIEQYYSTKDTLSLRLDQISFVKDIYLNNCTIVLDTNGKRLSPTEITLGPDNKCIKNGTEVQFLINESFDLTLTKQINLDGKNLIVDFSDCANNEVERAVKLQDITVRNWEMCNWKIKKFSLYAVPFLEKNSIEIEELKTIKLRLDLSKIYNPTSLLKLYCGLDTTLADAPFFLPNLVDVTLRCVNSLAKLPYFTQNKNISKLWLDCQKDDNNAIAISLNIDDFPKGVDELYLSNINVHGEGVCPLHTLYMRAYYPISEYSAIGAKFRSETFLIWNSVISAMWDVLSVIQLLNLGHSYGRLVIGSFCWNGTSVFPNSGFSNFVDREAPYYVFKGKRGTAFTEEAVEAFGYFKIK